MLLSTATANARIFELDAKIPTLLIDPFTDSAAVDTFFVNQAAGFLTDLTNLGVLNMFSEKTVLDYFAEQLTLFYPAIAHIDVLDQHSVALREKDFLGVEADAGETDAVITDGVEANGVEAIIHIDDTNTNPELFMSSGEHTLRRINKHRPAVRHKPFGDPEAKIQFLNAYGRLFRQKTAYFTSALNVLFAYVPLVYPAVDTNAVCTNLLLIDRSITDAQVFYTSANAQTLPMFFNKHTLRSELLDTLARCTASKRIQLDRICVVATNKDMYNNTKIFLNDEPYFTLADIDSSSPPDSYSPNVQVFKDLQQTYQLTAVDFLACESLTYTAWQKYYALLQTPACTIGASVDQTGNLAYGGNWVLESDNQNIQPIYFTTAIANYQTTLDQKTVNIIFGSYGPDPGTVANINLTTTTYTIPATMYNNYQINIYNSTNEQVTVKLSSISPGTNMYNLRINQVPDGYAGNGSKVTIDGTGASIAPGTGTPGTDASLFKGDSLITLVDNVQTTALTDIYIKNITVDVSGAPTLTKTKAGWICMGDQTQGNTITFESCQITSTAAITIGGSYNGGLCGGGNRANNDLTLTFDSCTVTAATGAITIGSGGSYNGGLCGGNNYATDGNATLTFTSCTVTATTGAITIGGGGGRNGGLCGGGNEAENDLKLTFTSCTVTAATGAIEIGGGGYYNGGLCGGFNGANNDLKLTFTSCTVTAATGLTIGDVGNGGLCGGGNGATNGNATLTFTSCTVTAATGAITIEGGSAYNGGLCGGGNGATNGNVTLTFNSCTVTASTGAITIGGGSAYNGGLCGGNNDAENGNATLTFTSCAVTAATGAIEIGVVGGGGNYIGGLCGGGNSATTLELTFDRCSLIAASSITLLGVPGYNAFTFNLLGLTDDLNTTPPTIETKPGVLYGYGGTTATINYSPPSLLLVATNEQLRAQVFTQSYKAVFAGYNLSGVNLAGVNLSNFNLTGTILTGANLAGVTYNDQTLITDSPAIAQNIVTNSGLSVVNNTYTLPANLNVYGMLALKNGLQKAGQNTGGMSLFVSGLFKALINKTATRFLKTTQVIAPTSILPAVQPWQVQSADTTVQFINASIYPNNLNLPAFSPPQTEYDLATLPKNTTFFYILVQNYPDTVTITSETNTLVITAQAPYQVDPSQVVFTCTTTVAGQVSAVDKPAGDATPIVFAGQNFYIGSVASTVPIPTPTPIISNICFPAGTPIQTDQGCIPIEKLDPTRHTLAGQTIRHITQTVTLDKYLILFLKNSLGRNYPSANTIMTKDHQIEFNGQLVPAERFLNVSREVKKVKYSGEILYNVLLKQHGTMTVNGLLCETLHPENLIAKLYRKNLSAEEKNRTIVIMNESLQNRDLLTYKKSINEILYT